VNFTTFAKSQINRYLQRINLRLETLTAEKYELTRLEKLRNRGHFQHPVFPLLESFQLSNPAIMFAEIARHNARFDDFIVPSRNTVGYSFANDYFSSPDAEVLYATIRLFQPARIVEIGCGNSTRVIRQALIDGSINACVTAIDPHPRTDIEEFVDVFHRAMVEDLVQTDVQIFYTLKPDDVLFIDSSHEIRTGNDVTYLYTHVLPNLAPGVLTHIHDIFLPYEYPSEWLLNHRWYWNEQYLVQALLSGSQMFEVLWPGHFVQRTQPDFSHHFTHLQGRHAKSLWLRKVL
jgi:predicted O-methyltransferase YrrM